MKKTYTVESTFNDMRLDRWIRNVLGNIPQGLIEKNLRSGKIKLNKKKVNSLIKGYETIKNISNNEKNSLNILCRGAALRYLLTRVYDFINTPKTALIKIKDPKEYYQKLLIHNKLHSFNDYIN